jgi:hypothetical protein
MLNGFMGWLNGVSQFLADLVHVIGLALGFTSNLPQAVLALPHPGLLALSVAVLAGISQLIGDSVILFVNRVRPGPFVAALGMNGLIFALNLAVEGTVIWLLARDVFGAGELLWMGVLVVFLGSAPLVFGFFIMAATLGPPVGQLLRIWSWLITLLAVRDGFGLTLWQALICIALARLLVWLIDLTFRSPLGRLNEMLWRPVTRVPIGMSQPEQQKLRSGETQREIVLTLSDKLRGELMVLVGQGLPGEGTK